MPDQFSLLADENIDGRLVRGLREYGHSVHWIVELDPGATDTQVLSLARHHSAILITDDTDFGELVFNRRMVHNGVLLLRLADIPWQDRFALVIDALQHHGAAMATAFSVLSPETLRVRPQ